MSVNMSVSVSVSVGVCETLNLHIIIIIYCKHIVAVYNTSLCVFLVPLGRYISIRRCCFLAVTTSPFWYCLLQKRGTVIPRYAPPMEEFRLIQNNIHFN